MKTMLSSMTYHTRKWTAGKNKYRIFVNREKVNKASLMDGRLPEKSDELGIDRLFAKNNSLKIGDTVKIER